MKSFLFAALSLVSEFSKDKEQESIHALEIEKNSEYIIEGKYANINNFWGVSVPSDDSGDYFYTFELEPGGQVLKGNNEVSIESLQEGDTLKITYDGSLALEYPPRLSHVSKIEVKSSGDNELNAQQAQNASTDVTAEITSSVSAPEIPTIEISTEIPSFETEAKIPEVEIKTPVGSTPVKIDPSTEESD